MKKILVFGGSGFLGYYLVHELISRDYEVTIADIEKPNISNVKFIHCDITKDSDLKNVFKNKFDFVYNLAGFANLDDSVDQPINTIELNVTANMKIIEYCILKKIKRYYYASSSYAMSVKGSFYGISKLASEKIIEEYSRNNNFNFVIIRYGSVYSEMKYHNNYIFNLVSEAMKTGEINHHGNGEEYREYIHASDAARLSVDLLSTDNYNNSHIVLTGNYGIKRIELFEMIKEIFGKPIKIKLRNSNKNYNHYKYTPYSFQAVLSKKLSPNPQIDLGQGILECIRKIDGS